MKRHRCSMVWIKPWKGLRMPDQDSFDFDAAAHHNHDAKDEALTLLFRDGLDQPIKGLSLSLTLPAGEVIQAQTHTMGDVSLHVPESRQGLVKVAVIDDKGQAQPVCDIDLSQCKQLAIVRSPKVKVAMPLRPHQQTSPPKLTKNKPKAAAFAQPKAKSDRAIPPAAAAAAPASGAARPVSTAAAAGTGTAWWHMNGAVEQAYAWLASQIDLDGLLSQSHAASAKTLTLTGQPVTVAAGPECPNADNLRLGRNNVYREHILKAAKRLGLAPQALCALMDCEAGKVAEKLARTGSDGTPMKDKRGKPMTVTVRELWNANAGNPQSGAAGLTQFLASTWLTHVLNPGFFIHQQSVAKGWVQQASDAKGRKQWVFVLADKTVTSTPNNHRQDDHVKQCLAMRMNPEWSINAAADYGNANLKVLEKHGFKLSGLSDMDKAKLMYLMHHEGEGAGPLFVKNQLTQSIGSENKLRKVFEIQLGPKGSQKAEALINDADGSVEVAYRYWFASFVDRQFAQSAKYFCSSPAPATRLSDILTKIGGKEIENVE